MTQSSSDDSASRRLPANWGSVTLWLVAVFGLTLLGNFSGPGWSPTPLSASITVQTADTTIGSPALTPPPGTYEVEREIVDVRLAPDVSVKASIYRPKGAPGTRPGLVFLHGAGSATHLHFEPHARALASAGIVAMVPDKRMDTYTTAERDYFAMATDYHTSTDYLRALPEVDDAQVGVYGESEGAYIASIIAGRNPETAFLILVSAPVVPPREQAVYATDNYLRNTQVPQALLNVIPRGLGAQFPGGILNYADFDVRPYQRHITAPVFMAYGTGDTSMPVIQGAEQVISDIARAGNSKYTVRYYDGADHGIKVNTQLVPEFLRDLARWIDGLPETAAASPRIAGAQPVQRFLAEPPPQPRWYASGDMMLYGVLLGPALALAGPLFGGMAYLLPRRRSGEEAISRAGTATLLRLSCAAALAAAGAWVLYAAYIANVANLALNYRTNALAVDGGWVITRLAAIFAVLVLVLAGRALGQTHRAPVALPLWLSITLLGLLGGALAMLISGAYWGIFAGLMPI